MMKFFTPPASGSGLTSHARFSAIWSWANASRRADEEGQQTDDLPEERPAEVARVADHHLDLLRPLRADESAQLVGELLLHGVGTEHGPGDGDDDDEERREREQRRVGDGGAEAHAVVFEYLLSGFLEQGEDVARGRHGSKRDERNHTGWPTSPVPRRQQLRVGAPV